MRGDDTRILAVYREPFGLAPVVRKLEAGTSLAAMAARMPDLPGDFAETGVICINGHPAPRALWDAIKPKPHTVTEITFHAPPRGGGGGSGGKNPLAIIAAIAITVATGFIAGGFFETASGLFAAGSVSAMALAAGVSLVGSLLISSLVKPPVWQQDEKQRIAQLGDASAFGNQLQPNGPIPRVIGTRKVFPPFVMEPLTYFDGQDEVVEVAFALAGPHKLDDIRVADAPMDAMKEVESEILEGWNDPPPPTRLLHRYGRTTQIGNELRGHLVSDSDDRTVETDDPGDIGLALPQDMVLATRREPEEHEIQIAFPQGLTLDGGTAEELLRVPLRLRIREKGTATWHNLPELHFQADRLGQIRATIKLLWTESAGGATSAPSGEGWVEARTASPGQASDPPSDPFAAHSSFYAGSGDDYLNSANGGATGVQNVLLTRYTATLYLLNADFPPGTYEIEIIRGAAFKNGDYSASAYTYGGSVRDFWGVVGTPGKIVMSKKGLVDTVYVVRSVSIWNENPLPTTDIATIAIRARNRTIDRLSVIASGYVRDWDAGAQAWTDWVTTSNPAPHLVDIWTGLQNADPLPERMLWHDRLVEWRDECAAQGYTVDAIIEDRSVFEAAELVAACGYAQPLMADMWGVAFDRDWTNEPVTQVFSPRNMAQFQWTKGWPRAPDGFRVNFADESDDYQDRQIDVFLPGEDTPDGRMEQIDYAGLKTEAAVRKRGRYDQAQARYRGTFYSFDVPVEHIMSRRGDLIGIAHDEMSAWTGSARIIDMVDDGSGNVLSILPDVAIDTAGAPFMDAVPNLADEGNLAILGTIIGVAIRDGASVHLVEASDGGDGWIDLDTPVAAGDLTGALVVSGAMGRVYTRALIWGIEPHDDLTATITAVDEAPEIWEAMNG